MDMLDPGDLVFHPKNGFGTVNGLTSRDPADPMRDVTAGAAASGREEEYYEIELAEGGTLLLPVSRAEGAGLRLLTNGVDAIMACLRAPAQRLPENFRERATVLRERGRASEPTALAGGVRDLLAQSRGRKLSEGERTWLHDSCERLSTEAALVDRITRADARNAIWGAVNLFGAR